jgi:regulator of sigma E protease
VNYVAALVSLWMVFVIGYPELLPVIGGIEPGTPAQAASLQVGDRVRSVNGQTVENWEGMALLIQASAGVPVALVVERAHAPDLDVTIAPASKTVRDPLGRSRTVGLIGVSPSGAFRTVRVGPVRAIGRTLAQHAQWTAQTGIALWLMATGKLSMRESVAGPIGIFYLTSEAMRMGISPLLHLVSLLSLSLAIFNLLPIPILDGGHLLFLAIERLRGRAVSLRVQERSTQVGFALLMALILVACMNDLSRFGITQRVMEWFR